MWRTALTIFGAMFLAELGDKTQLAVIAFSADNNPWVVFFSASLALVASTALAALFGQALLRVVPAEWLRSGGRSPVPRRWGGRAHRRRPRRDQEVRSRPVPISGSGTQTRARSASAAAVGSSLPERQRCQRRRGPPLGTRSMPARGSATTSGPTPGTSGSRGRVGPGRPGSSRGASRRRYRSPPRDRWRSRGAGDAHSATTAPIGSASTSV